jgi:hypothetical protein
VQARLPIGHSVIVSDAFCSARSAVISSGEASMAARTSRSTVLPSPPPKTKRVARGAGFRELHRVAFTVMTAPLGGIGRPWITMTAGADAPAGASLGSSMEREVAPCAPLPKARANPATHPTLSVQTLKARCDRWYIPLPQQKPEVMEDGPHRLREGGPLPVTRRRSIARRLDRHRCPRFGERLSYRRPDGESNIRRSLH